MSGKELPTAMPEKKSQMKLVFFIKKEGLLQVIVGARCFVTIFGLLLKSFA